MAVDPFVMKLASIPLFDPVRSVAPPVSAGQMTPHVVPVSYTHLDVYKRQIIFRYVIMSKMKINISSVLKIYELVHASS